MNLDTTTKVLQIVLGEAKTTNDCNVTSSYADSTSTTFTLGNKNINTNGTTAVAVVDAPDFDTQRQVKEIRLFNNDTVSHTVTLQLFDGTNTWIIAPGKVLVPANGSFVYTPETASGEGGGPFIVISAAPYLAAGTIASAGTISAATLAASSLIGNATTASAIPTAVLLGGGLSFVSGTLVATGGTTARTWDYAADTAITVGPPPAGDMYWNNATQTSATVIGLSHLTSDNIDIDVFLALIQPGNTLIVQDKNDSTNYQVWVCSAAITIHANSYVEVPVTLSSSGGTGTTNFPNNHALFVALFTTEAAGPAGGDLSGNYPNPTVAKINGSPLASTTPTAAHLLIANGSSWASVGMSGDATINATGTLTVSNNVARAAGLGVAINTGTAEINNQVTLLGTAGGTLTIAPGSGTSEVIIQLPTAGGAVSLVAAPAFKGQQWWMDIVQGATASTVSLNTGFAFGATVPSYTATPTPNLIDNIMCLSQDGINARVEIVNKGFSV